MSLLFGDLKTDVKRRSTLDQSGTQFNSAISNAINAALFRLGREALWKPLRRTSTFDTVTTYTTGSGGGTFTNGSKNITMTGATFLTDNIQPGRRIKLQGSSKNYTIKTITGETTLTIDANYGGTTISGTGTYSILPQSEYNLPVQATYRTFLWHEELGYPYKLTYVPEQEMLGSGAYVTTTGIPTAYRMWKSDMVIEQPKEASVITISSSSSADTSISVTVFGTVGGYPDSETITTNSSDGTTASAGSKSFTYIDRIAKGASSAGRITATANSTNTTVAVLPVGDTTSGIVYNKVELWELPNSVFPINVWYYKDPYRLVNDGDIHELGQAFDEAIVLLATGKLKFEQNQKEGGSFFNLYKDELRSLKKVNVDKIDWFPTLKPRVYSNQFAVHPYLNAGQAGANFGIRG